MTVDELITTLKLCDPDGLVRVVFMREKVDRILYPHRVLEDGLGDVEIVVKSEPE
jgi:hypothetical protein